MWINVFRLVTLEINTISYRSTYPPAVELASSSLLLSENKQCKENRIAKPHSCPREHALYTSNSYWAVPENINTPPQIRDGISWGWGWGERCSVTPQNLKKCMKLSLEFQDGLGEGWIWKNPFHGRGILTWFDSQFPLSSNPNYSQSMNK